MWPISPCFAGDWLEKGKERGLERLLKTTRTTDNNFVLFAKITIIVLALFFFEWLAQWFRACIGDNLT